MITAYAYLNARVSVAAHRLLSETQFMGLIHQPLGQHSTGIPLLDGYLSEPSFNPSLIEEALMTHMLTDFEILMRPLSGGARELLIYWLHKCEIANLKTIVRGKIGGLSVQRIRSQLIGLGSLSTLPIDQLLRTEDISELLRSLDHSPYENIAHQARRVFEKEHQLYSLDAALDHHYLLGFVQRIRALELRQREPLLPLVSIFMDRFNLLWLLRYRLTYHLSAAETYYLLVPTPYHLHRNYLKNLLEFNTLAEILAHLPEPLHTLLAGSENIFEVDQHLMTEVRRIAWRTLTWHHFTLARVFAYFLLREMEVRRLMAIIKGKKLQLKDPLISLAAEYSSTLLA